MIDGVGDVDPLGVQLIAFLGQRRRRIGLEGEMIKAGGNTGIAIDAPPRSRPVVDSPM